MFVCINFVAMFDLFFTQSFIGRELQFGLCIPDIIWSMRSSRESTTADPFDGEYDFAKLNILSREKLLS